MRDERYKCIDPENCWNFNTEAKSAPQEPGKVSSNHDDARNAEGDNSEVLRTLIGHEEPIYNRKILLNVAETDEKPVVDGFKKEIEPTTISVAEEEPPTTVKVPLSTEKVIIVEEMSIPVVIIHENP